MLFVFYFKPVSQRQRGTDVSCERCLSSLAARFDDLAAAVWSVYLSFRHKRTLAERRRPDPVWKSSVNCSFWIRVCFGFCVSVCMGSQQTYTHAGNTPCDLRPFSQLVAMRLNLTTYNFVLIRAQSYSSLHFNVEVFDCFARVCVNFKLNFICVNLTNLTRKKIEQNLWRNWRH